MARTVARPWPLQPLLDLTGWTLTQLAQAVGRDVSVICRRRTTGLRDDEANRWAVLAGLHPAEVWAGWAEVLAG